jgi:hypothetical protein
VRVAASLGGTGEQFRRRRWPRRAEAALNRPATCKRQEEQRGGQHEFHAASRESYQGRNRILLSFTIGAAKSNKKTTQDGGNLNRLQIQAGTLVNYDITTGILAQAQ